MDTSNVEINHVKEGGNTKFLKATIIDKNFKMEIMIEANPKQSYSLNSGVYERSLVEQCKIFNESQKERGIENIEDLTID